MSTPIQLDLELYRGDDYAHQLIFVDDQFPPEPFDLSQYSFKAQIRDRPEYGTIIYAEFEVDSSDAAEGILVLFLGGGATRFPIGYWDLQVDFGTYSETLIKGTVTTSGDVTQGVST